MAELFCTVCGGSFRPFTRECALECHKLVYETRRWRQYRRNLALASVFDATPAELAYTTRRYRQYSRNLYERARKAFVVQYHKALEPREPSRLWVVPKEGG